MAPLPGLAADRRTPRHLAEHQRTLHRRRPSFERRQQPRPVRARPGPRRRRRATRHAGKKVVDAAAAASTESARPPRPPGPPVSSDFELEQSDERGGERPRRHTADLLAGVHRDGPADDLGERRCSASLVSAMTGPTTSTTRAGRGKRLRRRPTGGDHDDERRRRRGTRAIGRALGDGGDAVPSASAGPRPRRRSATSRCRAAGPARGRPTSGHPVPSRSAAARPRSIAGLVSTSSSSRSGAQLMGTARRAPPPGT